MGTHPRANLVYGFLVPEDCEVLPEGDYPGECECYHDDDACECETGLDWYNIDTEHVAIQALGHHDYPLWCVTIKGSEAERLDDSFKFVRRIALPGPGGDNIPTWNQLLFDFAEKHSIDTAEPGWLLAASYG